MTLEVGDVFGKMRTLVTLEGESQQVPGLLLGHRPHTPGLLQLLDDGR